MARNRDLSLFLGLRHTDKDVRAWAILFYTKCRNLDTIRDMIAHRVPLNIAEGVEIALIGQMPPEKIPVDPNPCRAIEVKVDIDDKEGSCLLAFPKSFSGGPIYAINEDEKGIGTTFLMKDPTLVRLNEVRRNLAIGFFTKLNFGKSEAQKRIEANPQPVLHQMFR